MKLPSTVLSAMRGIGGATLIAAAVAGCGGGAAEPTSQTQRIVVAPGGEQVSDNRNREPDGVDAPVEPEYYDDMAVACGRG